MKAKDIINQLLESKSIKAGPFAKEIGVHPTQIYDLQSEKIKKISASIASKIVNRYPEYVPINIGSVAVVPAGIACRRLI